jgi:hypothetical protein
LKKVIRLYLVHLSEEASKARQAGDTHAVRGAYIECLMTLRHSLEAVTGPEALRFIDDIGDALLAAGRGHRHWLTALPKDLRNSKHRVLPVWRDEPIRNLLMADASALLHHYSRTGDQSRRCSQLSIAKKIADAMGEAGFKTERGNAPSGETIKDWHNNMVSYKKRKRKRPHPIAAERFDEMRWHLAQQNCTLSTALKRLKTGCRDAVALPVSTPVKFEV